MSSSKCHSAIYHLWTYFFFQGPIYYYNEAHLSYNVGGDFYFFNNRWYSFFFLSLGEAIIPFLIFMLLIPILESFFFFFLHFWSFLFLFSYCISYSLMILTLNFLGTIDLEECSRCWTLVPLIPRLKFCCPTESKSYKLKKFLKCSNTL